MVDGIPDYKTMRKLARRHMEDHEPERWRKNKNAKFVFFYLGLFSIILLMFSVMFFSSATNEIYDDGEENVPFVERYGVPITIATSIIIGGIGFILLSWTIIIGKKIEMGNLEFGTSNYVDYYLENVHQNDEGDD